MIKFQCECGRKIAAPDQWLGKRVKCPQCGKPVLVQESVTVVPAAPPEPAPPEEVEPRAERAPAANGRSASESAGEGYHPEDEAEPQFGVARGDAFRTPAQTRDAGIGVVDPGPDESEETARRTDAEKAPETAPSAVTAPLRRKVYVPPKGPAPRYANGDVFEAPRSRAPAIFGILALIVGLAGGGLFWIPVFESYVSPAVAGCGVLLAFIGIILSLRRDNEGMVIPALAIVISLVAGSLTWVLPLLVTTPSPPRSAPARDWTIDKTDDASESMRRMIVSVDSVRLGGDQGGPTGVVEYKLTNKGSKPIKSLAGSILLYDKDHKLLGGLSLDDDFGKSPLVPGASASGKKTWPMDSSIEQPLAANQVTAEYRAESVVYADDSRETFDK